MTSFETQTKLPVDYQMAQTITDDIEKVNKLETIKMYALFKKSDVGKKVADDIELEIQKLRDAILQNKIRLARRGSPTEETREEKIATLFPSGWWETELEKAEMFGKTMRLNSEDRDKEMERLYTLRETGLKAGLPAPHRQPAAGGGYNRRNKRKRKNRSVQRRSRRRSTKRRRSSRKSSSIRRSSRRRRSRRRNTRRRSKKR